MVRSAGIVPGCRPRSISGLVVAGIAAVTLAIGVAPVAAQDQDNEGKLCGRTNASPEAIGFADRGLTLTQQRQLDDAKKDLDRAIEIDPSFAQAFASRANFWTVVHDRERAMADANHAVELDPACPGAYFARGGAALHLDRFDQAIADYDKVLQLRPQAGAAIYGVRGYVYHRKGDEAHAIADYNEFLKLAPEDVGTLLNRGGELNALGDRAAATASIRKALEMAPDYPPAV